MKANECRIILTIKDGEVEGYTHVEVVKDIICECTDADGIMEDFFLEDKYAHDELHVFLIEDEEERVHPEITDGYLSYETGLHAGRQIVIGYRDYIMPDDAKDYFLEECSWYGQLDCMPALDICASGEEGIEVETGFYTHDKDGEVVELERPRDFLSVDGWKERLIETLRYMEEDNVIFLDEE